MSIKKRFVEMIKNGYPEFDQEGDSVEIEFEGGGDDFGSFHYIDIYPNREGDVDLNEDIGMPDDSEGIAVINTDNSNGDWEFSTNGGSNWTAMNTSLSNAELLTQSARIRFNPNLNYNGQNI